MPQSGTAKINDNILKIREEELSEENQGSGDLALAMSRWRKGLAGEEGLRNVELGKYNSIQGPSRVPEMRVRSFLLACILHLAKDDREKNKDYICL